MAAVICFGSLIDNAERGLAERRFAKPPEIPEEAPELFSEAFLDPSCRLLVMYSNGLHFQWTLVANETVHEVKDADGPLAFLPLYLFKLTQKNRTIARIRYYHKLCGFTKFNEPQWYLGVK